MRRGRFGVALGIVEAVSHLKPRPELSLQVRIGIATGLVVAGDLVGEGVSEERAVSGATPNLAARLQAEAAPNGVLISSATHNLVPGLFKTEDLGVRQLKGIKDPVRLWQVTGEQEIESRFDAVHAQGLTPLVARSEEIDLLIGRWNSAKQSEGQVVLLSGEPGIGKSRISQTLRERIAGEPHTHLRYQCSPYHTNSALYSVTTQLEFAAGFAVGDSSAVKLEKLEAVLAPSTKERHKVVPLLAAALAIPTGERYEAPKLPPAQLKERIFEAMFEQLATLAREQPVLFLFEDAHWVDPTTLELLDIIVERSQDMKLLVVITSRPEFAATWAGTTHVTSLTLNRLGRRHCEMLVSGVTGGKTLPPEVLDQIVTKTDGMPLFVEELTKSVLESGILEPAGEAYVLNGPLPPLAIPHVAAGLPDGAARSPVAGQGGRSTRRHDRPGVLLQAARAGFPAERQRAAGRPAISWSSPSSYRSGARHPRQSTASSTLWFRTPPTNLCSRRPARNFIRRSPIP